MKNLLKIKEWFQILRRSPYGELLRMTGKKQNGFKILLRMPSGRSLQNDRIIFTQIARIVADIVKLNFVDYFSSPTHKI